MSLSVLSTLVRDFIALSALQQGAEVDGFRLELTFVAYTALRQVGVAEGEIVSKSLTDMRRDAPPHPTFAHAMLQQLQAKMALLVGKTEDAFTALRPVLDHNREPHAGLQLAPTPLGLTLPERDELLAHIEALFPTPTSENEMRSEWRRVTLVVWESGNLSEPTIGVALKSPPTPPQYWKLGLTPNQTKFLAHHADFAGAVATLRSVTLREKERWFEERVKTLKPFARYLGSASLRLGAKKDS